MLHHCLPVTHGNVAKKTEKLNRGAQIYILQIVLALEVTG